MNHRQGVIAWGLVALALGILVVCAWLLIMSIAKPQTTVTIGSTAIRATLAKTEAEQQRGLSGVNELSNGQGMLFVFANDGPQAMWMKDMRIPLDIIWLSNAKKVTHIEHDLTPDTYPATYISSTPARYVLEVPAGVATSSGIKVGTVASFEIQ